MKILHYSDKASDNFDQLYEQCDILIATGDLTLFDFGNLENLTERKPSFGVYGNHCSGQYLEKLGIENLHNEIVEWNGVTFGGFQGCLKYKESGIMYTEEEARAFADTFPYVDVLLLHAGPKGMLDDPSDAVHIGSENIRRYVLEKKPKLVFLGHQYSDEAMQVDQTRLFRTYGARIIEL